MLENGVDESLAEDFAWIVCCAETNAEYGYGPGILLTYNATARDLIERFGVEKMEPVILALGKIGFALCLEDDDEVEKAKKEFLKVWKNEGRN